jgi:hypothetical protein
MLSRSFGPHKSTEFSRRKVGSAVSVDDTVKKEKDLADTWESSC